MAASAPPADNLPADLEAALTSGDWQARCQAVSRATGLLKGRPGPDPVRTLHAHLQRLAADTEWQVRQEVATALQFSPNDDADQLLALLAADPTSWVSKAAEESLKQLSENAAAETKDVDASLAIPDDARALGTAETLNEIVDQGLTEAEIDRSRTACKCR